jgi:hypothetical protein
MRKPSVLWMIALCALLFAAGASGAFESGRAAFSVRFKDEVSPYRVIGVFMSPGEELRLEAIGLEEEAVCGFPGREDTARRVGRNEWLWRAPEQKGLYPLTITCSVTGEAVTLNFFVMVPYADLEGGYLGEYRIGRYPDRWSNGGVTYERPAGFIEVNDETEDVLVAPHFTLGQFACKQAASRNRYLVLRERLVLKLEAVLERVNEKGYRADTFHIMSGYRTPYYNDAIGNVDYSRHLWGDAADIFIDHDRDGVMDDLNGDGASDYRDAGVLKSIIDNLCREPRHEHLKGGLARYARTPSHGPFVHIDTRGCRARWGI